MTPLSQAEFGALLDPLGPFEPTPRLAVAVSGGADSLALALLADGWARAKGGSVHGLIVDHGLRPEAAAEAAVTMTKLKGRGIDATILHLPDIEWGTGLAERARAARYKALESACRALGIVHLLLGHHAGDQAETVLMRRLSGSGPAGLAGMAALRETTTMRLLRPLLPVPPDRLRATLLEAGVEWVEDPSNADHRALRPRLRAVLAERTGDMVDGLVAEATAFGERRAFSEQESACLLAREATFRPEGFALMPPGPVSEAALSAVIQAISGRPFPPPRAKTSRLAARPRPATLAGTRLLPARRLGRGFLVVREEQAVERPLPAVPGAVWDGRFRLSSGAAAPGGATFGALGADSAALRGFSDLPAAVLRVLPAVRRGSSLFAVPHIGYPDNANCALVPVLFSPPRPAACARFVPCRCSSQGLAPGGGAKGP